MNTVRVRYIGVALAATLTVGASVAFAAGAFAQGGSASGTGASPSATAAAADGDCWALLQRDKVKLPAAAQTALGVASADPNSHPGCAIMVGP